MIAIDPGTYESAYVELDGVRVLDAQIQPNEQVIEYLRDKGTGELLAIEKVMSYGMAVGASVFRTVFWSGRFVEAYDGPFQEVPRLAVKLFLCKDSKAKDANIRQALIDMYGPTKQQAIGTKREPGPLHGFKSHLWAALAVGITAQQKETKIG